MFDAYLGRGNADEKSGNNHQAIADYRHSSEVFIKQENTRKRYHYALDNISRLEKITKN